MGNNKRNLEGNSGKEGGGFIAFLGFSAVNIG
jgi:hypothetical protein